MMIIIIKYSVKYIKDNILKLLPMIFSLSLLFSLLLFGRLIENSCFYLNNETKKEINYEIRIEGRMTTESSFKQYFEQGEDIKNEYEALRDFFEENDANYHPVLETLVPDQKIFIAKDPHAAGMNDTETLTIDTVCLYGIDETFFDDNGIEIIDGRGLKKAESGSIIVNEDTYRIVDDRLYKIEVGDVISFPIGFLSEGLPFYFSPIEFIDYEVIGIYRSKEVDIINADSKDYKLNKRFYVAADDVLFHLESFFDLYKKYHLIPSVLPSSRVSYYLPDFRFNDVVFRYENEDEMQENMEKIETFIEKMNEEKEGEIYAIRSSLDIVDSLLSPLTLLESNVRYYSIFALFISAIIFALFLLFLLGARKTEFSIKQVMGMSRSGIINELLAESILLCSISFLCGFLFYRIFGISIVNRVFSDGLQLQNNLIRIVSGSIDALKNFNSIKISYQNIGNMSSFCVVLYLGISFFVSALSVLIFMKTRSDSLHKSLTG